VGSLVAIIVHLQESELYFVNILLSLCPRNIP